MGGCVELWIGGLQWGEALILRREAPSATDERGHVTAWRQRCGLEACRLRAWKDPQVCGIAPFIHLRMDPNPRIIPTLDHSSPRQTTNDAAAGARTGLKEE